MGRRVLVSGGAGFIGSHVAAAYVAAGDEVTVLDDLSNGAIAHVFLDGVQLPDVDTFAPIQEEFQAVMFAASGLAAGQHTLAIEVSGQSTPGSTGVMVVIDAFDVY